MTDSTVKIKDNMELYAQVMGLTPDGCYNPVAHVTHISHGTFKCAECDDDHLRLTFKIRLTELGGKELIFHLCDDDALTMAHECGSLEHYADRQAAEGEA